MRLGVLAILYLAVRALGGWLLLLLLLLLLILLMLLLFLHPVGLCMSGKTRCTLGLLLL